jgi:uncharacterized protein YndB with AHSA1/START domain
MPAIKHHATVTTPNEFEIHVERIFEAPRELVWRAQTDSNLLARWWGRGHRMEIVRNEVRPGGRWRFVEHAPDGDQGFEGEFRAVHAPDHMVLTFGWDGMPGHALVNTVEFEDLGDGRTALLSTMRFETTEERDGMLRYGMEQGMNESHAALDELLATLGRKK